jgi:mono/diheme cytochrome c family protein
MIGRRILLSGVLIWVTGALVLAGSSAGQQGGETPSAPTTSSAKSTAASAPNDQSLRVEGEKRFQANCGRCHQSPHKFPLRMVMTIERHMRVRATLTDEDMRLIVRYLTQ